MSTSTPRRSTRSSLTRSISLEPTESPVPTTPSRKGKGRTRAGHTVVDHTDPESTLATPRRRSSRLSATPAPSLPKQEHPDTLRYTIKEEEQGSDDEAAGHVGTQDSRRSPRKTRSSADTATPDAPSEGDDGGADQDCLAAQEQQGEEKDADDVEAVLVSSPHQKYSALPDLGIRDVSTSQRSTSPSSSIVSETTPSGRSPSVKKITSLTSTDRTIRRIYLKRRILGTISSFGPVIRPMLIIIALALLSLLPAPMPPFAKSTYVDENALQPGSANVYWDWSEVGFCDEVSESISALARTQADAIQRADYISSKLLEFGLEPHTQEYRFEVPMTEGDSASSMSSHSGVNTYARWQSGRSDGREAVIIAASWLSRWDGSNDPDAGDEKGEQSPQGSRRVNNRGIAMVLGLSRYLSFQSHWSKDIIFVFSDGYMEGMQAWATSYFGAKQSNLHADPLSCTGAVVWNAIAVDYPSDSFSSLVVLHDGLDGQLPNMDVLNTLVRVADRVGRIPVHLPGDSGKYTPEDDAAGGTWGAIGKWLEDKSWGWRGVAHYEKGAANLLQQMRSQAFGHPSGIHGLFQRFHVDAITLYAVPARGPYGFWNLGRIMESMMRSFSNLLERLHHSQFFYLLTRPDKFVPLGVYLPVALLMSVASTMTGIAMWMQAGRGAKERKEKLLDRTASRLRPLIKSTPSSSPKDLPLEYPTHADLQVDLAQLVISSGLEGEEARSKLVELLMALDAQSRPVARALLIMAACHAAGAVGLFLVLQPRPSLGLASAVVSLTPLSMTLLARSWSSTYGRGDTLAPSVGQPVGLPLAQVLHAFTLLETGMAVAVLSVLNFSAATVMALLLVLPLYSVYVPQSRTSVSKITRVVAALTGLWFLLALQPLNIPPLVHGAALYVPHVRSWTSLPLESFLMESREFVRWALRTVLDDWYLLGTAFLPILCLVYTPVVLQAVVVTALVAVA